jgi:hypothetical protein
VSTAYLCDTFSSPVANARILDTEDPANLQTLLNGAFIIRVPDGVLVENPLTVTDLLNQKYQGLLAEHSGLLYITFDDLLDATHVDPTSGPGYFGQRSSISLAPGGTFSSIINAGAGTPLTGSAPGQAIVTWEVFTVSDSDPSGNRFQRTYIEMPSSPSIVTCSVSFNGGTNYISTTDSAVLNISPADQGTAFIIRLTNVTTGRLFIGSWACIY